MSIDALTRTCQNPQDQFSVAGLVAALERCWAAIRARHPEIPAAVIVVASGSPASGKQGMKWGHFASLRWQHGQHRLPEVLVSGEGLSRTPAEVFTTLLHEAAHALAHARGIKDTSRQGRWHNQKFAHHARELGLEPSKHDKLGWSPCTLPDLTAQRYKTELDQLAAAISAYRHPEPTGEGRQRTNSNNGITCQCTCPRKLRISPTAFAEGPIVCAVCGGAFLPDGIDRATYQHPTVTARPNGDPGTVEEDDPMVFYDPTGARYGIPTYPYHMAPKGLATLRQLRARNLRPGGQAVAAQILWRRGTRKAYLYRIDAAKLKRTATPAQRQAIAKALQARRTCPTCQQVKPYYIPRRHGACLDCTPAVAA